MLTETNGNMKYYQQRKKVIVYSYKCITVYMKLNMFIHCTFNNNN